MSYRVYITNDGKSLPESYHSIWFKTFTEGGFGEYGEREFSSDYHKKEASIMLSISTHALSYIKILVGEAMVMVWLFIFVF